jgi:hypothetical protein
LSCNCQLLCKSDYDIGLTNIFAPPPPENDLSATENLVRMVMCQSALLQHIGVERISFLDTRRWLGAPGTGIP